MTALIDALNDLRKVDTEAMRKAIERHRDLVVGMKVRVSDFVAGKSDLPAGRTDEIFNVGTVLSKFLMLGMPLADIAVMELRKGSFEFVDNDHAKRTGQQQLVTTATILGGKKVKDPMRTLSRAILAAFAATISLSAQSPAKKTPEQTDALIKQHKGDFDYLLGDWTFVANNKQYGKSNGRWSCVKTATGQLLDEYRLVDDKGATFYVTSTIRNYNVQADRWELIGMDSANGLQDFGTAQKVGNEMHIEQRFGVAGGTPNTLRIRYYNIKPDSFSWAADRSDDGGKTWTKDAILIEAKRTGPARTLPALGRAK